ncbi:MAG: 3-oxoacyl-ACP synthase [Candidatus Atribacteria bacterium]|nr:MAG: 3-oxoacyl-ACP synthase [Candidatus Atribacteria bacterium]
MAVYIRSTEAISPQNTFHTDSFLSEVIVPDKDYFSCIHPDYKEYINPRLLRRMSNMIRMGLAASTLCLDHAGLKQVDAILIGTGLGCVEDTLKFLDQIIDNQEELLNPTAFIQSTHNTVSGQIALMLGCRNHNLTFSQKTISFESALLEGIMWLKDKENQNILVGGIDELVDKSFSLMVESGCARIVRTDEMMDSKLPGALRGEGSTFFAMSNMESPDTLAQIDDMEIINRCPSTDVLITRLEKFLNRNGLSAGDIDVVVSGKNGDVRLKSIYDDLNKLFAKSIVVGYKHLVGDYDTASAFGCYLASKMIHLNVVPECVRLNDVTKNTISRCLVVNYSRNRDFSCTLLSG